MKYELDTVVWETTLLCNLRCLHCGSSAAYAREDELSTAEALALIRELGELHCKTVVLMGGEPFLRKDWRALAEAVRGQGMQVRFISNGFNLDEEVLQALVEIQPRVVGISIDGACAETHDRLRGRQGSFQRAVRAVDLLKDRGIPVTIITALTKPNVFELDGLKDLVLEKGTAWQIQVATPKGSRFSQELMISEDEFYYVGVKLAAYQARYTPRELLLFPADCIGYHSSFFPHLMTIVGEKGCQAGVATVGVQSNGNVKSCLALSDKYIEGSIRERSLKEMWQDPQAFPVNRQFHPSKLGGYCASCKYGEACQGGCSDMADSLTGNPYDNPCCFYRIEQKKMEGGDQDVAAEASTAHQSDQ